MIKVLFTVESYYPKMSGVPVVVKYLAEGLAHKKDYDVHIATRWDHELEPLETINNVKVHRFDLSYNIIKKPRGKIREYTKFITESKFDYVILECTQCVTTDVLFPCIDDINSVFILHSHGFSGLELKPFCLMSSIKHTVGNTINYFVWSRYYKQVLPSILDRFTKVICLSRVDRDYGYFIEHKKEVAVLSNAAEEMFFNDKYDNNISDYIGKPIKRYFITVAYYSDVKNQIGVLEQYYESESGKDTAMVFIGTEKNDYYSKLQRRNQELKKRFGHREVFSLTGVQRKDIPGIVNGAEIYLSGSAREAFSISLVEAMALGVPFIGTDVGNTSELPGGITVQNIKDMHIQIDEIHRNQVLQEELIRRGKQYARENCRVGVAVNRLKELIESNV